jgi:hypothetical protein
LSEEFVNDLGTTEMILRTVRAATATSVEVTSPIQTTLECQMVSRTVQMEIVGGAPGRDGTDGRDGIDGVGAVDPGDLTLYFENGLT